MTQNRAKKIARRGADEILNARSNHYRYIHTCIKQTHTHRVVCCLYIFISTYLIFTLARNLINIDQKKRSIDEWILGSD